MDCKTIDGRLKTQDDRLKTQNDHLKTQDGRLKTQDDHLKTQDDRLKTQDDYLKTQNSYLKTQKLPHSIIIHYSKARGWQQQQDSLYFLKKAVFWKKRNTQIMKINYLKIGNI
ncbi:MAG TPA: hypothetical protein VFS36_15655 [Chitinophagaceae bacterium]|nr:hypothetical protein [Chitinophagaceae bacterium]